MNNSGEDQTETLVAAVRAARGGPGLCIVGGGSKAFLTEGRRAEQSRVPILAMAGHHGIIDYRPDELVVTVRAGTRLIDLEATLAAAGQYLPFEPPRFTPASTIGGAVAAGLSGPGRPWRGALRDAVLGVEVVNGLGEHLRFGGQVMKNVAGYDLSRLQAGAFGTLGVLLAVSLKVLPQPSCERTLVFDLDAASAVARCRAWSRTPLPLSGACHVDGRLHLRLSGAEPAVAAAIETLGGMTLADGAAFWSGLRDGALPFFQGSEAGVGEIVGRSGADQGDVSRSACADGGAGAGIWRASLPPAAPIFRGECLVNWGGAERWWREPAGAPAEGDRAPAVAAFQAWVAAAGGTACRFDATFGDRSPIDAAVPYVSRLKDAFDPDRILNPHLGGSRAH